VMRQRVTPLSLTAEERDELVDVVGTGGGGPLTFNISSGAALVAAAAGAKVAKHGNRAVTSLCGAADVLEALGVPIALGPELAVECLRETGFMFLFAPLYHPAMKVLGPLRRALGFRTILNLCGPLTNPAGARAQVIGVLAPSKVLLVGRTLAALGAKRALFDDDASWDAIARHIEHVSLNEDMEFQNIYAEECASRKHLKK